MWAYVQISDINMNAVLSFGLFAKCSSVVYGCYQPPTKAQKQV